MQAVEEVGLVKVLERAGKAGEALLREAAEEMGVDFEGLVR